MGCIYYILKQVPYCSEERQVKHSTHVAYPPTMIVKMEKREEQILDVDSLTYLTMRSRYELYIYTGIQLLYNESFFK